MEQDPIFNRPLKAAKQHAHGVQASKDSHAAQDREGILERRQRGILGLLGEAGPMGRTALEIEQATGEGHGKVSGALSAMHRDGMISALKLDRRNGHGVYVLNEQVGNRLTRAYQPNGTGRTVVVPQAPAPARPRLTQADKELLARIRPVVGSYQDKAIIQMRPTSVQALIEMIDRLSA